MRFSSFGDLAKQFESVALRLPAAEMVMLEEIGVAVETRAKSKLGHYQPGWPPLSSFTLEDKAARGFPIPSPLLRTGEMQASIGHTVTPRSVTVGAADKKAVFHELGTSKMPARPFIGPSMIESMPVNLKIIGKGLARAFRG